MIVEPKKLKMKAFGILVVLIMFSGGKIFGQEIVAESGNRFSTESKKISCPIEQGNQISIVSAANLSGGLVILAGDVDKAEFSYKKYLKVGSESEAVDYAEAIDVKMEKRPNGCALMLQAPNPAPWQGTDNSGSIEGELTLPKNSRITIDAQYFDLNIRGPFKSIENGTSFGRIEIKNIEGLVNLTTSNQNISASDITGEISLTTSHADIELTNIKTTTQPAYIVNENGGIMGDNLNGAFDIKNNFGRIKLNGITLVSDGSRISGSYSPIYLNIVGINNGGLTVRNTNEDIKLDVNKSLSADFSFRVDSGGDIDIVDLPSRPVMVDSDRIDIVIGDGGPKIRVAVRGEGNIDVRGE